MYSECVDTLLALAHPPGWKVSFHRGRGWCPAKRHIDACEKALIAGATHILILGADQTYQPDLLCRMADHASAGRAVVAGLVPARGYFEWNKGMRPFAKVAWRFKATDGMQDGTLACRPYRGQDVDGDMIELVDPADGVLQKIHFVGSGCLFFDVDVMLALKRPFFYETYDQDTMTRTASMDTRFVFRMVTEGGADAWVDCSLDIQHLHIFRVDDSFPSRFQDWATPGIGDPTICRYEESRDGQDCLEVQETGVGGDARGA